MNDRPRHRTVSPSEIAAHPFRRFDAGYWLAPNVVRDVMDAHPSWSREKAEAELDRRRVTDADDALRFLLDGLGLPGLAELRAAVEALRVIAALDDDVYPDALFGPEFYAGRGEAVDIAREALGLG